MQMRFGRFRPDLALASMGLGNSSSRQIYLTFPADSTFKEEDVSNYFSPTKRREKSQTSTRSFSLNQGPYRLGAEEGKSKEQDIRLLLSWFSLELQGNSQRLVVRSSNCIRNDFMNLPGEQCVGTARGCGWQKIGAAVNLGAYYIIGLPCSAILTFLLHYGGMVAGMIVNALNQCVLMSVEVVVVGKTGMKVGDEMDGGLTWRR
ncbi:hypothetical protein L1987_32552 [Smallanthus sonchifolius]|uniref:Uncharacterized protein n=1 Tax=Smallanthus sonchifolius TaxID=185202 RepID=A0ACB9HPT2_9ASTR|nr:hypothetical protein L1987_32552 [Smallanthus sonchifolius]